MTFDNLDPGIKLQCLINRVGGNLPVCYIDGLGQTSADLLHLFLRLRLREMRGGAFCRRAVIQRIETDYLQDRKIGVSSKRSLTYNTLDFSDIVRKTSLNQNSSRIFPIKYSILMDNFFAYHVRGRCRRPSPSDLFWQQYRLKISFGLRDHIIFRDIT